MQKILNIEKRAELISEIVNLWLDDDSGLLEAAVEKTAKEGLFQRGDIIFALNHVRESVNKEALLDWVHKSVSGSNCAQGKDVLCLHAGNLPLVGFQDILAVLLSGNRYLGKLSRKDPYLPASFLQTAQKILKEEKIYWSVNLHEIPLEKADIVLFSGSEKSVPNVLDALNELGWLHPNTKKVIRTAHASVAWFEPKAGSWDTLTEAIFRYDGKGCRSVACVFTSAEPAMILQKIAESAASYLEENPPENKTLPALDFRGAYNFAIQKDFIRIGNLLLEAGDPELKKDGVVTVTKATIEEMKAFRQNSGHAIQSMYSNVDVPDCEQLSEAQRPPISWKPDGKDVLRILTNEMF